MVEIIQHWHFLYFGSLSQDLVIDEQEQQLCSLALKHNDNASCSLFLEEEERCLVLQYVDDVKIPAAAVEVDMFQRPTFASHIICHSVWPDASLKKNSAAFPMASKEHLITYQTIINESVQKRDRRSTEPSSLEAKTMHFTKHSLNF